jgi:hypothetical protein
MVTILELIDAVKAHLNTVYGTTPYYETKQRVESLLGEWDTD